MHEMPHWLGRVQELVGDGRWILIGDWNAQHAEWSLEGRSDSVGKVSEQWRTARGTKILRSRSHTFDSLRGDEAVVSRIDFGLAGGGVERGGLSSG